MIRNRCWVGEKVSGVELAGEIEVIELAFSKYFFFTKPFTKPSSKSGFNWEKKGE